LQETDAMPETRHETEAEKILAALSLSMTDEQALSQSRRILAEALERAERRGRQMLGSQKESSG
jgi:vacuolar-type H+-ATPase subunit H